MSAGAASTDRLVAELERKERTDMAIREESHQEGRTEMRIVVARASWDRPLVREVERPGFWVRSWRYLNKGLRSRAHVPRLLEIERRTRARLLASHCERLGACFDELADYAIILSRPAPTRLPGPGQHMSR